MEALLLNPTPPPQKPASQPAKYSAENEGSESFSPAMEKAAKKVDKKNEQASSVSKESPQTESSESDAVSTSETPVDAETSEVSPSEDAPQDSSTEAVAGLAGQLPAENAADIKIPKSTLGQTTNQLLPGMLDEQTKSLTVQKSPDPPATTGTETQAGTSKAESMLLQQIQQILDQGKNNGSIVITGSTGTADGKTAGADPLNSLASPLLTDQENVAVQSKQIGISLVPTEDSPATSSKNTKLESSHQDLTEQFLNAKFGDSKAKTDEGSTQHKGGGEQTKQELATTQTQNQPQSTLGTDAKPIDTGFTQQLHTAGSTTQTTSIEGKLAPGAHLPISESDMVNNLIQKFNVNPRLQTSKLSMQLHPAELGALKIDIVVKDDSIKANIVAQSQQVFDTLEKHMPRLRAVLEDQGFTVDSFKVVMDDNSDKQRELFQEQFSSQQQEFSFTKSTSQDSEAFDALLDAEDSSYLSAVNETGVNVTA